MPGDIFTGIRYMHQRMLWEITTEEKTGGFRGD
jgi:hypothetical protein